MKSTTTLQVDTDVLLKLVRQLHIRGGAQDLPEAVTSAIELWLTEQARLQAGADPASVRGYQWKTSLLSEAIHHSAIIKRHAGRLCSAWMIRTIRKARPLPWSSRLT